MIRTLEDRLADMLRRIIALERRRSGGRGGGGYRLIETLHFTSSGTFRVADYPGMRAVRVRVQGGGGAGGGRSTSWGRSSGGGGGAYAERLIAAADLPAGVPVTVGAGGAGIAGADGGTGGFSRFGATSYGPQASGGEGGIIATSTAQLAGGAGGIVSGVYDLVIPGGNGSGAPPETSGWPVVQWGGGGGESFLGSAGALRPNSGTGFPGRGYGAGGSGAAGTASAAQGGDGAPGIVIVEVYG